jgi:hypothetical protein
MSDGSKLRDHLHENTYHIWIQRAQDKDRWRSLLGTVVGNLQGNSWPAETVRSQEGSRAMGLGGI